MKRSEFITQLASFLETFPPGCSHYHICDMLLSYAERRDLVYTNFEEEDDIEECTGTTEE